MSKDPVAWVARLVPCGHTAANCSVAVPEIGSQLYCHPCGESRDVEDVVAAVAERDRRGRSY